jgi:hypothetical protein
MPKTRSGASKISGSTGNFFTQRHALARSIRRSFDATSLVAVVTPPDDLRFPSYSYLIRGSIYTKRISTTSMITTRAVEVRSVIASMTG